MSNTCTAVIKQDGKHWIGWIEEVPGVNCQAESRDELLDTLQVTLAEHTKNGICRDLGVTPIG